MIKDAYKQEFDRVRPDEIFLKQLETAAIRTSRRGRQPVSRRLIAAVAAILILLLSATAVAVVRGNLLRSKLEEAGAADFAAQVQDVHIASASDGFSLAFDEFIWEGSALYISYSAAAPDDGETYLLALSTPQLSTSQAGKVPMLATNPAFIDDYQGKLIALGGEYPNRTEGLLKFDWIDPALREQEGGMISMHGVFLRALWPVEAIESKDWGEAFDASGDTLRGYMRNGQLLLQPWRYPEVQAILKARGVEDLSAEMIVQAGMGTIVHELGADVVLDASALPSSSFDRLSENHFEMDGYTLDVLNFSANLLHADCEFRITRDGGIRYDESRATEESNSFTGADPLEGEPLARSYALLRMDGAPLAYEGTTSSTCVPAALGDGGYALDVSCATDGILSLHDGAQVLLAPLDAEGNPALDEAVALTLIHS